MTRLYRSQRDKKISGLCGGLAETLNVDATLLRLVVVVTAVFSAGTVILLYILASIVIPKEPTPPNMYSNGFGQSSHDFSGHYSNVHGRPTYTERYDYAPPKQEHQEQAKSDLDAMMEDVEKKAMWKEIEELKAKLAKYEKGE